MRRTICAILLLVFVAALPAMATPARGQEEYDTRLDVGMIIDNSGSMKDNDPRDLRYSAAKLFINLLAEGDQVGVVSMGDRDSTKTKLTLDVVTNWNSLAREAFKTPDDQANWTYMGESLDLSAQLMENAARYSDQRAIILLTDGLPTYRDEHRAEQEAKFAAAVERFRSEGIRIFPIALGAAADVGFLEQQLAAPTGGTVWRAENADQLLRVYIEILARLQEGRYVDTYDVLGNVETFLANINPRQEIEQVNFVFPENNGSIPELTQILIPISVRVVDNEVSRQQDAAWSMYIARPDYIERIEGEWRVELKSPQAQVPMIAVVKSDLRTQLLEPISSVPDEDSAVRYYPAGRPLLLRAGVRGRSNQFEKRIGLSVEVPQQASAEPLVLADEGTAADLAAVDGHYSTLTQQPLEPGQHTLSMNITPFNNHLRLSKRFDVAVEPLPTMQVAVKPEGRLAAGQAARIEVRWALDGQPAVMRGAEIVAAVRRDDRVITTVPLEAQADGTWLGEFQPAESGNYAFGLTAHAEWESPDRGPRRYSDYVDIGYDAVKQPEVDVDVNAPAQPEAVDDLRNGIQRTITVASKSERAIELRLDVAGLPDATVYPDRLVIEPGETGSRTVTISSPAMLDAGDYQAALMIDGGDDVVINANEMPLSFSVNGWLVRYRVLLLLGLLVLLPFTMRRVRAAVADFVVRNVELVRYGGR